MGDRSMNVVSIHDHVEKAWDAYVSAQRLAERTMDIEDGKAAGRAWRRWLSLFTPDDQKHIVKDGRASA